VGSTTGQVVGCLVFNICRDSLFGIENTVQAGRFGIRIPAEAMIFSLLLNFQTGSWAYPPSSGDRDSFTFTFLLPPFMKLDPHSPFVVSQ
jgi:hypothetical protein